MLARIRRSWPRGTVPSGQNLRDLDENTARGLDGHRGGICTPASQVVIAGAGATATQQWEGLLGAGVDVAGTPASKVVFGKGTADDAFIYDSGHAGRVRTLNHAIDEAHAAQSFGVASFSPAIGAIQTQLPGARFFAAFRRLSGASLSQVAFRWKVGSNHANVPEYLPRFRVVRVHAASGRVDALRAEGPDTDREGFVMWGPRPSTGALYYDSSATKTFVYVCNQNNLVDRRTYFYRAEIEDERGSGAFVGPSNGNHFISTDATHTTIPLLLFRQ